MVELFLANGMLEHPARTKEHSFYLMQLTRVNYV